MGMFIFIRNNIIRNQKEKTMLAARDNAQWHGIEKQGENESDSAFLKAG